MRLVYSRAMLTEWQLKWMRGRTQWGTIAEPHYWALRYRAPHWEFYNTQDRRRIFLGKIPELPTAEEAMGLIQTAIEAGYGRRPLFRLIQILKFMVNIPRD